MSENKTHALKCTHMVAYIRSIARVCVNVGERGRMVKLLVASKDV